MKRNKLTTAVFVAVIALSGMVFISCGGGNAANSIVDDAISAAEEAIPLEESPVFGILPSLFKQELEAGTIMGKQFRELKTEDMDEAVKNKQKRDEAEKALADYYKKKISEVAGGIDGKTIKTEFDAEQISSANVTLKLTDKERGLYNMVFDVTLTKPVNKGISFVWEFRDAEGNVLETYNDYITPGDKFNKEWMISADLNWSDKFDHLFIKFNLF